jgi:CheY-like chemotaxis protein
VPHGGVSIDPQDAFAAHGTAIPGAQHAAHPEVRVMDILVVDDQADICRAVQHLLERHGHAVTTCMEGLAAVELIARHDYGVALVDLNLADVHGSQVIQAARAARPHLPIVVMSGLVAESGRSPPDFLGMSIRVGGLYRLAKPFKPKDLLDLIAEILASPPRTSDMNKPTRIVGGR